MSAGRRGARLGEGRVRANFVGVARAQFARGARRRSALRVDARSGPWRCVQLGITFWAAGSAARDARAARLVRGSVRAMAGAPARCFLYSGPHKQCESLTSVNCCNSELGDFARTPSRLVDGEKRRRRRLQRPRPGFGKVAGLAPSAHIAKRCGQPQIVAAARGSARRNPHPSAPTAAIS